MRGRDGAGYYVHFGLEAHAYHIQRIAYAFLVIDDEGLGDDMEDFPVHGYHDCPGRLDDAIHVLPGDLAPPTGHRDHPAGIDALDARSSGAAIDVPDLAPRHELGCLDGGRHGRERGLDVHHDAATQPGRGDHAHADDLEDPVLVIFPDHGARVRRADVEADY